MYWYKKISVDKNISKSDQNKKLNEAAFSLLEENLISSLGCSYINNNNWQHLSEYDD